MARRSDAPALGLECSQNALSSSGNRNTPGTFFWRRLTSLSDAGCPDGSVGGWTMLLSVRSWMPGSQGSGILRVPVWRNASGIHAYG